MSFPSILGPAWHTHGTAELGPPRIRAFFNTGFCLRRLVSSSLAVLLGILISVASGAGRVVRSRYGQSSSNTLRRCSKALFHHDPTVTLTLTLTVGPCSMAPLHRGRAVYGIHVLSFRGATRRASSRGAGQVRARRLRKGELGTRSRDTRQGGNRGNRRHIRGWMERSDEVTRGI